MLGQTVIIAVGDVAVGERKRPLNEEKVAGLAASIGAIGLLQPIVITERYGLVAGRHRLEAVKRLGWLTAPAVIAPVDGLRAELAEIDENLIRNELTVLEQAEHLLRRSEILEALGERASVGGQTGNKNASKNEGATVAPSFARTTDDLAAEMGISKRSSQVRFQVARGLDAAVKAEIAAEPLANRTRDLLDLARLEPEEQRRVVAVDGVKAGETSVKRARRLLAVQTRREASPWPEGKYHVIYADPPWQYEAHGATVDAGYGGTGWHYPSMTVADLCALPVRDLAAADCALWIWVTSPKLNQVWAVLEAWGFTYKTSFVWDKVKHNFGYYNSVRHEFLLIAGRGSSTPENAKLFDSVQTIERSGEHSEKPEEFRRIIETLYPSARKIELFARRPSAGWDAWGNEALGIEAMGIEAMGSNGQHAD